MKVSNASQHNDVKVSHNRDSMIIKYRAAGPSCRLVEEERYEKKNWSSEKRLESWNITYAKCKRCPTRMVHEVVRLKEVRCYLNPRMTWEKLKKPG